MPFTLNKFYVAVTVILISITAQVNAANCCTPEPSCCEPNRNRGPSPCCAPICRPSPYSGPNCIPAPYCQEVNVRGELLYWTAMLGGLETAFGSTTIAPR